MRTPATAERIHTLLEAFGRAAKSPGCVFLTGGSSAALIGWRPTTVDVDLKFDPEPAGVFSAIPTLKNTLDINIELACPSDFIPELPGWRERSQLIARHGQLACYHYDFDAQALAKLERGHDRDLLDVGAMLQRNLIEPQRLLQHLTDMDERLLRYPAIDPTAFHKKVERWVLAHGEPDA